MTKKIFSPIFISCFVLLAIALTFLKFALPPKSMPQANAFLTVVYDGKITIPNTGVTISYPKKGFNGEGVTLGKSKQAVLMIYENVGNLYVVSKPNGIPTIEVDAYKLGDEKTLEEVIAKITKEQMPEASKGQYQIVNGQRYFILPESGGISTAYTLANGHLVDIIVSGGTNSDIAPHLLPQTLSHIDFSCKGDCSSNADPMVDMGKQGEG